MALSFDADRNWLYRSQDECYPVLGQVSSKVQEAAWHFGWGTTIDSDLHGRRHQRNTNETPEERSARTASSYMAQHVVAKFFDMEWRYSLGSGNREPDIRPDIDVVCTRDLTKRMIFRENERKYNQKRRHIGTWVLRDDDGTCWVVGQGWAQGDEFMAPPSEDKGDFWAVEPSKLRSLDTFSWAIPIAVTR